MVLSGTQLSRYTWRTQFFLSAAIAFATLLASMFFIPADAPSPSPSPSSASARPHARSLLPLLPLRLRLPSLLRKTQRSPAPRLYTHTRIQPRLPPYHYTPATEDAEKPGASSLHAYAYPAPPPPLPSPSSPSPPLKSPSARTNADTTAHLKDTNLHAPHRLAWVRGRGAAAADGDVWACEEGGSCFWNAGCSWRFAEDGDAGGEEWEFDFDDFDADEFDGEFAAFDDLGMPYTVSLLLLSLPLLALFAAWEVHLERVHSRPGGAYWAEERAFLAGGEHAFLACGDHGDNHNRYDTNGNRYGGDKPEDTWQERREGQVVDGHGDAEGRHSAHVHLILLLAALCVPCPSKPPVLLTKNILRLNPFVPLARSPRLQRVFMSPRVQRALAYAPPPLLRPSLFTRTRGRVSMVYAIALLQFAALMVRAVWVQLYYQVYIGYSPVRIVVRLMPMFITELICNVVVALIVGRVKTIWLLAIGTLTTTITPSSLLSSPRCRNGRSDSRRRRCAVWWARTSLYAVRGGGGGAG
ncbi:hypothetical protein C8R44DRAFT_885579 [Mycena epipterygia]|nr:hypothetical protein C8R44DRAFT_885579 [Mycena epipterygia]